MDFSDEKSMIAQRFRGFLPVVIDVETGGFNCQTDAVLEIAATFLRMDDSGQLEPDDTVSYHVEPFEGANLEPAALEFTGIDPHNPLRQAQKEVTVMGELMKRIRQQVKANGCTRAVLVGHNAHFDLGFVLAAIERSNIKRNPFHPFSVMDTASLSGLAYGHTVLARACQLADIDFNNSEAHSAAYDAFKTAELFCQIVNRWQQLGGWRWP
ncbi:MULTISPECIES: ribonuclease T [Zhongshania]|uniref:Ribonuclease T n=1 Tax=Zhongshania aquimaris TaxID=2857107 RepID=A0ABS6VQR8_9GAMM|nr:MULTISPECIES: ribonuclease T [Zhongshania]MBQ0796769.1 ribonuclease T [Zhongshania sp.]MBW2940388.1 ribonuclease T [Zhongshania aquimaris]|tara:strand:+ start:22613 stop:23245 length:633 start_codon:yes stop_codon:yes gene_type:complete